MDIFFGMVKCSRNPVAVDLIFAVKGTPICKQESDFGEDHLIRRIIDAIK